MQPPHHASPLGDEHTFAIPLARLPQAGKDMADLSFQSCHFAGDLGQHGVLAQLQQLFVPLQPVYPLCQGEFMFRQKTMLPAGMCPVTS